MASRAKQTRARRNSKQKQKPATIDLDAKEVKAEAETKTSSAETEATQSAPSKDKSFGRPEPTSKDNMKTKTKPANAKAEPEKKAKAPTPPTPAQPTGSFMSKLSSAFMGGVAALIGFGAIGLWEGARELPIIGNFYGSSQPSSVNEKEVADLRVQIEAIRQATVDLTPVNQKISVLETGIAEIASTVSGDETSSKLVTLEKDISTLNTSIAEITAAASEGNATSPVALATAIASLDKRLDAIEVKLDTVASSVSKNPVLDKVSNSIGTLEAQVSDISQSVSSLKETTKANSQGLTGLSEQSTSLQDTVASVKASEKVARSVAVNALATALENDDALSLPISSVKALIGETPETNRLEALNAAGIPTRKDLVSALDEFTSTIKNPNAPPKEGSIADRFWANAQNMVSFRASGPRQGDDPLSVLSRVKANIEDDKLSDAKTEWEKLPADTKESGTSWLDKLNARLEAFGLQNALNQKLTAEAG